MAVQETLVIAMTVLSLACEGAIQDPGGPGQIGHSGAGTKVAEDEAALAGGPSGLEIEIRPGDDIQALVDANPAGTTFRFRSGVHRYSTGHCYVDPKHPEWGALACDIHVMPKSGDVFLGDLGAVLNGSRLLENFERISMDDPVWVARGQTQEGETFDSCAPGRVCKYPEDLFVDDIFMARAATRELVTSATWFFDYPHDEIVIGFNPAGHKVETSVARHGFMNPDAHSVVIRNLTIEKYATPGHTGAIAAEHNWQSATSRNWVIQDNEIRFNHGAGIRFDDGWIVSRNFAHHNGQMGLTGNGGQVVPPIVEDNDLSHNNTAGFDPGNEAGGAKVAEGRFVFRRNYVHHNDGRGLWGDVGVWDTLYEYNQVEHNAYDAIMHEISYAATIRFNTVRFNGSAGQWGYGAGILVSSSSDVEIYGNQLGDNRNGIVGIHGDREPGLFRLRVHDNDVTVAATSWLAAGVVQDSDIPKVRRNVFLTHGLVFANNIYRVPRLGLPLWAWRDGVHSFDAWRAFGQEAGGREILREQN